MIAAEMDKADTFAIMSSLDGFKIAEFDASEF
jgi:hypothetical protein